MSTTSRSQRRPIAAHTLKVLEFDALLELLAGFTSSAMGRRTALEQQPYLDSAAISLCLEQTDEAMSVLASGEKLPLETLHDIEALIDKAKAEGRPLEPSELLQLGDTLRRARGLARFVQKRREKLPRLVDLAAQFLDHQALLDAFDLALETPNRVLDAASPNLGLIRRRIRKIEAEIQSKLTDLLHDEHIRPALQNQNYTLREGRYVLALKLEMRGRVRGIVHDRSQKGATVFVEPEAIIPLANDLREQQAKEHQEVARILWDLTRQVFDQSAALVHTANLLAWFDLTQAKAKMAVQDGMKIPRIAQDGSLRLRGARHPLLMEAAKSKGQKVVPIDIRLRDGFDILVITGPNTGGKTLALKTLGLAQLMFQAGMPIAASQDSRLPIFRTIEADIGDEQSLAENLSTFSGHIKQVARILAVADKRSLILLDELGSGTDPSEGAALGRSILTELRDRRSAVAVTTHLGSLKEFAFANDRVENACVDFDPQTLKPKYTLLIGQPGLSHALTIAKQHGLVGPVIERAEDELRGESKEKDEMIDHLVSSRRALEETKTQSEKHLQRSRNLQKAAEEKQRHLQKKSRRLNWEADNLIDETLRGLNRDAEPHLKVLLNGPKTVQPDAQALRDLLANSIRRTSLAKRRRQYIETLKKKDMIFVPKFGQLCRLRKIHRAEETLQVEVGTMRVEIPYDDISWLGPEFLDDSHSDS